MSFELTLAPAVLESGSPTSAHLEITSTGPSPTDELQLRLTEHDIPLMDWYTVRSLSGGKTVSIDFQLPPFPAAEDRLSRVQLRAELIALYADNTLVEHTVNLPECLIMPRRSIYFPHGVPVNDSFQGRDELYSQLFKQYFQDDQLAIVVQAPGMLGKTTFISNLPLRPMFANVDLILLDAGGAGPIRVPRADRCWQIAETLASLIFPTQEDIDSSGQRLQAYLREISHEFARQNRYLLVAMDTLEHWLDDAAVDLQVRTRMRAVKSSMRSRLGSEPAQVKWLFSGTWKLNSDRQRAWSENLDHGQIYELKSPLTTLSPDQGKRIATEPARGFLEYDAPALDRLGELTGWHPCLVQLVCSEIYASVRISGGHIPHMISRQSIEQAAGSDHVRDGSLGAWRRTLASFGEVRLVRDVFRAITALGGESVSIPQILNRLQEATVRPAADEAETIADALGIEDKKASTLESLVPGLVRYLHDLGFLSSSGDPPRYRFAAELFIRHIPPLPRPPRDVPFRP